MIFHRVKGFETYIFHRVEAFQLGFSIGLELFNQDFP